MNYSAKKISVSCILLFHLFFIFTASCSHDESATDRVHVTGINTYISENDLATGTTKTMGTSMRVNMSHQIHEENSVTCSTCHHKEYNDERIKTCAYCHKGREGVKTIHGLCIVCHTRQNAGPAKCDGCHKKKKDRETVVDIQNIFAGTFVFNDKTHETHKKHQVGCNICHHDSAEKEKKKKKCHDCHEGKSKTIILHYFCKDCHKKTTGPVNCGECHIGVTSSRINVKDRFYIEKTGHRLPAIVFNHKNHIEKYDTECTDCHHKGSIKKCSSCHTKKDEGAVINIKGAYHQQCHECHRRTSGPQGCKRCHHNKI